MKIQCLYMAGPLLEGLVKRRLPADLLMLSGPTHKVDGRTAAESSSVWIYPICLFIIYRPSEQS